MSARYSEVSDYWNRRPCNIRHSDEDIGSFAYFEGVRERRYFVEPHIKAFARFPHWWGKRVLDIGCGIGTDTIEFALNGAKVTAVNMSERSLDITESRVYAYSVQHKVQLVDGNMENLPAEVVGPFDLIWAWGSIHHTPKPHLALNEIRRLCGPGTTVRLMLYNRFSTKAAGLTVSHWKKARMFSEAQEGCPITHWYSADAAVKMVQEAGFVVSNLSIDHIFPYDVAAYRQMQYKRRFPWNVIQGRPFRWLERNFGWHLLLEAKPCAHAYPSAVSANSAHHSPPFSPAAA